MIEVMRKFKIEEWLIQEQVIILVSRFLDHNKMMNHFDRCRINKNLKNNSGKQVQ
jgi:hypothetical protein